MKRLSRAIAVVLCMILMFSAVQTAVLASDSDCTPTIRIIGIASYDVTDNEGNSVFPMGADDFKSALTTAIKDLALNSIALDVTSLTDVFVSVAYSVFSPAACDENGDPVVESGVVWDYPTITETNHSGTYRFIYDWRLDPVEVAAELKEYVDYVRESSGHDRVDITAFSLGSCIFNSYYELYSNGGEHIRNVTYLSPACNGVGIASDVFNSELTIDSAALAKYVNYYLSYVMGYSYGDIFIDTLAELGILDIFTAPLNSFINSAQQSAYEDVLLPIFVTMPCMWAMLPAEYYDGAKATFLADTDKYSGLIEKLDRYHYNVQLKNDERLKELYESDEHNVAVIAKYNLANLPLTEGWQSMSDGIVDTTHASFGATCALQGTTLAKDYAQQVTACSHNHLSADSMIDASTCVIPEATWFVRDLQHSDDTDGTDALISYVQKSPSQASVWDNEMYPQFMKADGESIVPLSTDNAEDENASIYDKYTFFRELFAKIRAYILAFLDKVFKKVG